VARRGRPRPTNIDRLSSADRRVLRRLARSTRKWVVPPQSPGRQGELAGTVAIRVESARDRVRQQATREMAAARQALGRLAIADALIADREGVRDRARDHLDGIEARIAADPGLIDPSPPEPSGDEGEGPGDGPPIPWTRLLLVLGFVVLEYFLSLRVPELLGIEGYQVEVIAAAFALALVVLPKMVGGSLRDAASSEKEKKTVRWLAFGAAFLGTGGAVTASAAIREILFDPEATEPPGWCMPMLAVAVSLASFAMAALAPDDAQDRAAEAREHLRNEVRRVLRSLRDYFERRRPLDLAKARAAQVQKDLDEATVAAKQAEGAVEAARAERAETLGQLGEAHERIRAALAEAEWAERSAVADQRALLQALANMTLLESDRPAWPMSWFRSERRPWLDGIVHEALLPEVPSGYCEPLDEQAQPLLETIDALLVAAYPDATAGAA
jgi:hypothetical protein